jgi:hypothetical protein
MSLISECYFGLNPAENSAYLMNVSNIGGFTRIIT